jgi:manganese-dependent inorganic pyrophosphatase
VSKQPTLVTCYVNPDLDGVAGIVAYAEFLKQKGGAVVPAIIGVPHEEAQWVFRHFDIALPMTIENANDFPSIILVDASDLNGLEGKIPPSNVVEIIDHREVHEVEKFMNTKSQMELVGAAATLITEKFTHDNSPISKTSAILLYAAIISNTLNFQSDVTTERDRQAAQWLNRTAQLPIDFANTLFASKSNLPGPKLTERIYSDFAWFSLGAKRIGIAQLEVLNAKELVDMRKEEILRTLAELKQLRRLDFIFQNTVDLSTGKGIFVSADPEAQGILEQLFDLRFSDDTAVREKFILRKQIVPLLKKALLQ